MATSARHHQGSHDNEPTASTSLCPSPATNRATLSVRNVIAGHGDHDPLCLPVYEHLTEQDTTTPAPASSSAMTFFESSRVTLTIILSSASAMIFTLSLAVP